MTAVSANNEESLVLSHYTDPEHVAKLIFLRIDPVLRVILTLIRQHQTLLQKHNKHGCLVIEHKNDQKLFIDILQTQAKVLVNLTERIEQLESELSKDSLAVGLVVVFDYITLPSLAILRLFERNWSLSHSEQEQIRQSALWKCGGQAALTLSRVLALIRNGKASIKSSAIIKALIVGASALPSGSEGKDAERLARMDRGDAFLTELLSLLSVLIRMPPKPDAMVELATEVSKAMNGTLIARVTDSIAAAVVDKHCSESCVIQSLVTLDFWINSIAIVTSWRKVFPGLFPALYRCLLYAARATKSNLAITALRCLCSLIKISLQQSCKEENEASPIAILQALALKANSKSVVDSFKATNTLSDDDAFFAEVNDRLPAPLCVLVKFLASARSSRVREAAAALYGVILVDARNSWDENRAEGVLTAALEMTLVLSCDQDRSVSKTASEVLATHLKHSKAKSHILFPAKVKSLMEQLPVVACERKTAELDEILRLLIGYLSLVGQDKAIRRQIKALFSVDSAIKSLQQVFACVFDVDFEVLKSRKPSALMLSTSDLVERPHKLKLRFLSGNSEELAIRAVQCLAEAFGSKMVTFLVDSCFADLFASCVARAEKSALTDMNQIKWLHEWLGVIRLSKELVLGLTRAVHEKKGVHLKFLSDLTTSLLPIITTSPLWDLPTGRTAYNTPGRRILLPKSHNPLGLELSVPSLTTAYRGNAAFSFALLDFISEVFVALGADGRELLSVVIYPVVEKIGNVRDSRLRDMAIYTLRQLADSCDYVDVVTMLNDQHGSLVGAMIKKLRVPGGGSLSKAIPIDESSLHVAIMTTTLFNTAGSRNCTIQAAAFQLSSLEAVVEELLERFDYFASSGAIDEDVTSIFVDMFLAALFSLSRLFDRASGLDESRKTTDDFSRSAMEPWFDLLSDFRINITPRTDNSTQSPDERSQGGIWDGIFGDAEVRFITRISDRCAFLLSHKSLGIQIKGCAALVNGFALLSGVAKFYPERDEANGPKTAILRRVASLWPTVLVRVRATLKQVSPEASTSFFLISSQPAENRQSEDNIGEKRLFLAGLLELLGAMVVCSGDFMASRFRDSAWPLISSAIGEALRNRMKVTRTDPRQASELTLLDAALRCLRSVFTQDDAGRALAVVIPSIVGLVLPLLEDEDLKLVNSSAELLTAVARIDCDALTRPLTNVCGRKLGPCPIRSDRFAHSDDESCQSAPQSSKLSARAAVLLNYIDTLPEQPLYG